MQSVMGDNSRTKNGREMWIDYIKVFACILVVLGHFFQSMVKASILSDNGLYQWFDTTVYYFHVPLFFICSGYLYQKYSHVDNFNLWKNNVFKKAISLGIPYFVFSFATWLLKTLFADSVNGQIGGLGDTLFIHPTSPYWFLYILFFIFVVTPTIKTIKGAAVLSGTAIAGKALQIAGGGGYGILQIYAVSNLLSNLIWFVLGMMLAFGDLQIYFSRVSGAILGVVFLLISFWSYKADNAFLSFAMGLLACAAVFMVLVDCKEVKSLSWFAKYTMPIFLMHTLFAAPCRVLLMKLGIVNAVLQVSLGIFISFAGPIVLTIVLKKLKPLDFMIFPGDYIHIK